MLDAGSLPSVYGEMKIEVINDTTVPCGQFDLEGFSWFGVSAVTDEVSAPAGPNSLRSPACH